ncbi:MAG: HEAT repeat domain-containing protein [Pseudomonadota bacterium]
MSENEVHSLFAKTLDGEYDDDEPWDAIHALRKLGTDEVFVLAAAWCKSKDELRRSRGVDILAQLGSGSDADTMRSIGKKAVPVILKLLQTEKAGRPKASAIYALGHIGLRDAIPAIVRLTHHFDPDVRHAVAFSLGSFADEEICIDALLELMGDKDNSVRDWATFSLGSLGDADSPRIRRALAEALNDADDDVRFEAAIGLGKRRDRRSAAALEGILVDDPDNIHAIQATNLLLGFDEDRAIETVNLIASLRRLRRWGKQD